MTISASSSPAPRLVLRGATNRSVSSDAAAAAGPKHGRDGLERDQRRPTVHRRHAGDEVAADRAEVAGLHGADRMGGLDQGRKQVADERRSHDLAVGDDGADPQTLVGEGDACEVAGARDVDHDLRARPRLELHQQVGSAGEDAGAGAVLREQRHRVLAVSGGHIGDRIHRDPFRWDTG